MRRDVWLWGSLLAVVALYLASRTQRGGELASDAVGFVVNALSPRGIRNNNPGNIEWINNPVQRWRGMIARDGRYGIFDTPANGVRAIGGELKASVRKGQNTVHAIISEWAPEHENPTSAYVTAVANALGVNPTTRFDVLARLPEFAAAIIRHENGQQPYAMDDIRRWVNS